MESAFSVKANKPFTALEFEALNSDSQQDIRNSFTCMGCGEVAWFRSATKPNAKVNRGAHFNSHHLGECAYKTSYTLIDDFGDTSLRSENAIPSVTDYIVNLDNTSSGTLSDLSLVPLPMNDFVVSPNGGATGVGAGVAYETNASRTLRQILSYLKRFPEFRQSDKTVQVYSEAGHIKVNGKIKSLAVNFDDVTPYMDDGNYRIFWGLIVDAAHEYTDDGLWLNASDSRQGLSIKVFRDVKNTFLESFKISDLENLKGAYVLVAGQVRYTVAKKKPIVYCASPNFITVQKYRERLL
jgi:hypothetical protein